jgi:hypothetical protein
VLGAFPEDPMLRAVRLDEVLPALEAQLMFGSNVTLDQVRCELCVCARYLCLLCQLHCG